MSQTTRDAVTLAMRTEKQEPYIDGAETDTCDSCGEEVWISPATRHEIEHGAYPEELKCVTCTVTEDDDDA